ncbi:ATP-binding cassette domain-containing protein [Microbacterium sp. GXF7504]
MPDGQVLEFEDASKTFGRVAAVSRLTATIEPGAVTGFLGPNGAGKTTSLRMLLGLVAPTSGRTRIGGKAYADLKDPLRTVGAALEATSFHPGRTAAGHLAVYSRAAGIPRSRADEVLGLVGLADVAGRKVGGFSLGMRQRLALATALLGDPGVLVLDEPTNGLDPEGITWMRTLLRMFAREGRTVLVSSHLLGEVQQTADRLLIMSRGHLVFAGSFDELADPGEFATLVDSPDRAGLTQLLRDRGWEPEVLRSGVAVRGAEPAEIGAAVAGTGVALSLLTRRGPELEEIFLELVNGVRVAPQPAPVAAAGPAAAPDPASPLVEDAADLGAEPVTAEAPDVETPSDQPAPTEAAPEAPAPEPATDVVDAPAFLDEPDAPTADEPQEPTEGSER